MVKTPQCSVRQVAGIAASLVTLLATAASAQRSGSCPGPETKQVLVTAFRGDTAPGIRIANEVRDRIAGAYNCKELLASSKKTIDQALGTSGFKPDSALALNELRELATLVHADEIIDGDVVKAGAGYQLKARFFLARNVSLSQPLGTFDGKDFGDVARKVVDEYGKARKQIPDKLACENAIRDGRPAVGIDAARKALIAFPKSTFLRVCMASGYAASPDSAVGRDSVVAITNAVLALDPSSRVAYQLLYAALKQKGQADSALKTLVTWLGNDPTNSGLPEQVTVELVNSGKPELALPIVRKLMADNRGDPQFARTYWIVLRATKNYKESVPAGAAYVALDPTAADSNYFDRQIADLNADSAYAKAAEFAAMASAKYPRSAGYLLQKAQAERKSGQLDAAKATLQQALAVDPKVNGANYILAQIAGEQGNTADLIKYAKADAAQDSSNKSRAANLVVTAGSKLFTAAGASKKAEDFRKVIPVEQAALEIAPSGQAELFQGLAAFYVVAIETQDGGLLRTSKSCEDYKQASDYLAMAAALVPKNGRLSQEAAATVMTGLPQLQPFVDQSAKKYCK